MVECPIGEVLVRSRLLVSEQLERGLSAQVSYGGRLGTNLVELGLISLDQLSGALAQQHGVPTASVEAFEGAASAVLGAISREICGRFNVVPLEVSGATLHVAMMDPQHLTLVSRLGNALGMTIMPYAAPQLRLLYYLERHYGLKRPDRYLRIPIPDEPVEGERRSYLKPTVGSYSQTGSGLARTLTGPNLPRIGPSSVPATTGPALPQVQVPLRSGGPEPAQLSKEILVPDLPSTADPEAPEPELVMLDDRGEPMAAPDFGSMPDLEIEIVEERREGEAGGGGGRSKELGDGSRAGMLTLDEAIERIERATSRQALLKQLIHPVLPETTLNLLLLVRGDVAIAIGAWGTDLAPTSVRALALPLGMDSLLKRAYQERVVVRAPAVGCRLQKMIAVYFRNKVPCEACVTPICLGGKVVNMICTHAAAGPFSEGAVGDMLTLSARAAMAYKRLLDDAKS